MTPEHSHDTRHPLYGREVEVVSSNLPVRHMKDVLVRGVISDVVQMNGHLHVLVCTEGYLQPGDEMALLGKVQQAVGTHDAWATLLRAPTL